MFWPRGAKSTTHQLECSGAALSLLLRSFRLWDAGCDLFSAGRSEALSALRQRKDPGLRLEPGRDGNPFSLVIGIRATKSIIPTCLACNSLVMPFQWKHFLFKTVLARGSGHLGFVGRNLARSLDHVVRTRLALAWARWQGWNQIRPDTRELPGRLVTQILGRAGLETFPILTTRVRVTWCDRKSLQPARRPPSKHFFE